MHVHICDFTMDSKHQILCQTQQIGNRYPWNASAGLHKWSKEPGEVFWVACKCQERQNVTLQCHLPPLEAQISVQTPLLVDYVLAIGLLKYFKGLCCWVQMFAHCANCASQVRMLQRSTLLTHKFIASSCCTCMTMPCSIHLWQEQFQNFLISPHNVKKNETEWFFFFFLTLGPVGDRPFTKALEYHQVEPHMPQFGHHWTLGLWGSTWLQILLFSWRLAFIIS